MHEEISGGIARLAGATELGAERPQLAAQLAFGPGRVLCAERPSHDRGIGDVLVTFVADEGVLSVSVMGGEEAVEFGDVHPGE